MRIPIYFLVIQDQNNKPQIREFKTFKEAEDFYREQEGPVSLYHRSRLGTYLIGSKDLTKGEKHGT